MTRWIHGRLSNFPTLLAATATACVLVLLVFPSGPASAAQLPALGTDHRGRSLEFAQYDTRLDKTGIDTRLDKTGIDTRLDKTGIDTRLDKTGIDNPANPIRQAQPAGDGALIVPIAPPSAITDSPGVTIIGAPAEGDAIESSTGPTIIRAPDATQE